jgi:lantibiotic modifying enzyme
LYLLSRGNENLSQEGIRKILTALYQTCEESDEGIAWQDFRVLDKKSYNLGLAHGIPSIISLLSKIVEQNIYSEESKVLLEKSVSWLLKRKQASTKLSIFANNYHYGSAENDSRLAWCYGDLGIAMSLLSAGIAAKNKNWQQEAISIGLHASRRRNLKENSVLDVCLCHGTTGIAHTFNRLYHYTKVEEFKDASIYWYLKTFEFFELHGHVKVWNRKPNQSDFGWLKEYSILEGGGGVALSLISAISDIEPKWDRSLLLS